MMPVQHAIGLRWLLSIASAGIVAYLAIDRGPETAVAPVVTGPVVAASIVPRVPARTKWHQCDDCDGQDFALFGSKHREGPEALKEMRPGDGTLSKGEVVGAMSKIKRDVADCFDRFRVPGLALVAVTAQMNGRNTSAVVTGSFAGTPTGGCVEKAVRKASFPSATSATLFQYPFMLR